MIDVRSEILQPEKNAVKATQTQKQERPKQEKSFFQEIKEKATKAWGRFKEGLEKLWKKAGETFESVNKKAGEISEKTKVARVKDFFKAQAENFKTEIQARGKETEGLWYDFASMISRAKVAFWANFMGGKFAIWRRDNEEAAKRRMGEAKKRRADAAKIREKAEAMKKK